MTLQTLPRRLLSAALADLHILALAPPPAAHAGPQSERVRQALAEIRELPEAERGTATRELAERLHFDADLGSSELHQALVEEALDPARASEARALAVALRDVRRDSRAELRTSSLEAGRFLAAHLVALVAGVALGAGLGAALGGALALFGIASLGAPLAFLGGVLGGILAFASLRTVPELPFSDPEDFLEPLDAGASGSSAAARGPSPAPARVALEPGVPHYDDLPWD